VALASAFLMLEATGNAQWLTLANPDWNISLTDFGYSDFLLDNTPGFEGREYLSGEWGAAVAYQVGGAAPVPTQRLQPNFMYPDWVTSSTFNVVTPLVQTGVNADGLPVAESVISNDDLEITLRHEMIDTVLGTPMGVAPASGGGAGQSIQSSRYVLKQTCTIRNLTASPISGLQFFQFLHGLHSQRGVVDNRVYAGPYDTYRHDVTLAGVDPWAIGAGSSTSGLEDFIGFHAASAPTAFEIGHYGIEGNGVDDHWSGKPTDGVHRSVEDNWQTVPYSTRQGTDSFAPPQLWVAGAQRWNLGGVGVGQSVSHEILLSVRTGTVVDRGPGSSGGCNGGSAVPGGLDYEFEDVSESGSCFAEYTQAEEDEISVRVSAGEFGPLTFPSPGMPAQLWNVNFTGVFSGSVHLTVGYDSSILPPGFDASSLCLYLFDGVAWQKLTSTVDPLVHTIGVTTTQLGPLALGAQSLTLFSITATADPVDAGNTTGSGSYVEGASVSLTATPLAGYVFARWMEGATEVSTSPSYTFPATADRALTASFVPVGTAKTIATRSLPSSGGTTSGDGAYEQGTTATVVAVPAAGYKFSKWREGETVVSTSASYSFTVSGDRSLEAKFKAVYTLTVTAEPENGGEVEGDPQYEIGEVARVKAKPDTGYAFVHWTQNGIPVSTNPQFEFAMTGNRELVGHFAEGERVDLSSIPPHAGTTSGGGVYPVGALVNLNAVPEPGYEFVHWTENDVPVSTSATYSFTSATARVLVAHFQLTSSGVTAPIVGSDTLHRFPNRAFKIRSSTLLDNDSSPGGHDLSIVSVDSQSANGARLSRVGDWIVFEPLGDSSATDSFLYRVSDGIEQTAGLVTVLLDPEPESQTLNLTGSLLIDLGGVNQMQVRAAGIPGRSYKLQFTASLVSPTSWADLGVPIVADGVGEVIFVDSSPASPRFYRVIEFNP